MSRRHGIGSISCSDLLESSGRRESAPDSMSWSGLSSIRSFDLVGECSGAGVLRSSMMTSGRPWTVGTITFARVSAGARLPLSATSAETIRMPRAVRPGHVAALGLSVPPRIMPTLYGPDLFGLSGCRRMPQAGSASGLGRVRPCAAFDAAAGRSRGAGRGRRVDPPWFVAALVRPDGRAASRFRPVRRTCRTQRRRNFTRLVPDGAALPRRRGRGRRSSGAFSHRPS